MNHLYRYPLSLFALLAIFLICTPSKAAEKTFEDSYLLRMKKAVDKIADEYNPPSKTIGDPEKYYWPKAMARFYRYGTQDATANSYVDELCVKGAFHFAVVGMTRLIYEFPEAPSIKSNLYRILDRNLRAGLVYSEGTENHLSMERTSIYLLAQKALESDPDNILALQTLETTREWILTWAKRAYLYGVGEWNSSTYTLYNLIGWLNLYDYAEDEAVKLAGKAMADYYAAELALHYSWGAPGGSEMRGNAETDKNRTSASYLAWLWFAEDTDCPQDLQPAEYIQLMHPILSSYYPSPEIIELSRKKSANRDWYQNSKPSYLYEQKSFCKQDFYVSDNFTLGNLVSAYGGYTGASYAIIPWRLVIKKTGCPYEIGGGGKYRDTWTGQMKTPFTQTVQYKNTLISMTRLPLNHEEHYQKVTAIIEKWKEDWEHDYCLRHEPKDNVVNMVDGSQRASISYINLPGSLQYEKTDRGVIVDAGEVMLLISTLHTPTITTRAQSGRTTVMDESQPGELAAYVLEVIEKGDYPDIGSIKEAFKNCTFELKEDLTVVYHNTDGNILEATFNGFGSCMEPLFDWGYGATEPMCMLSSPPLRQPEWGPGDGFGKIPEFKVDGATVDYDGERPVYEGPDFCLADGILTVSSADGTTVYEVDYSGEIPIWSTTSNEENAVESITEPTEGVSWRLGDDILNITVSDGRRHALSIYGADGRLLMSKIFKNSFSKDLTTFAEKYLIINIDNNSFKILR